MRNQFKSQRKNKESLFKRMKLKQLIQDQLVQLEDRRNLMKKLSLLNIRVRLRILKCLIKSSH